ncbi:MAG: anaerobic ribonucleoside-triphosphate reductase activating protein [Desulfovibrio sp.]|uniref:anaerobic ribonucleoside-triphosphate reductase activating protein n=1 Tax=Desulfovibrio sp. 7SRBS1 TaxID=3378064 RepID=UPI003B3F889C
MHDKLSPAWQLLRGLQPLSLCDWPGHTTCVLFFGGCNLRCPTCHNANIAWHPEKQPALFTPDVVNYIERRKDWLDGIVISGGEPTIVPDFPAFLQDMRSFGLPVKVDTNGLQPGTVSMLLEQKLADAFFVDVKGPWHKYPALTGDTCTERQAQESLEWIFALAAKQPDVFRFRLTKVPLLDAQDIETAKTYLPNGFKLTLQDYVPPRRSNAQQDKQTRRLSGDLVHGEDCPGHSESPESERGEGPAAGQTSGGESRSQAW